MSNEAKKFTLVLYVAMIMIIYLVMIHHNINLMVETGNVARAFFLLFVIVFATVVPVVRTKLEDKTIIFKTILSVPPLLILAIFVISQLVSSIANGADPVTRLMYEVENGDSPEIVEQLFAENKYSEQTIQQALKMAIYKGEIEDIPILIKNGADLNNPDIQGYIMSKLEDAAFARRYDIFLALLKLHPDLTIVNNDGSNILETVIECKDLKLVKALIEAGMDINNEKDALMIAVSEGDDRIVDLFINTKADLNSGDKNGNTALIIASEKGYSGIVRALLKAHVNVNLSNDEGETALMRAVLKGHTEVVKLLLDGKADVNLRNNFLCNVLMLAAYAGHTEIVKILLNTKININARSATGRTALMSAVRSGNLNIVKMLIDSGADVKAKDKFGLSALHIAQEEVMTENVEIVKFLKEKGLKE